LSRRTEQHLATSRRQTEHPRDLGDDVSVHNISAYNHGIMGYQTPNIDRFASEGALFTDSYAQQSCTAGRASFILGQHPFTTGLLTIGMPGSDHGIPDWAPALADLLKEEGYMTAQYGKNHLGDQDKHLLPTAHGFDEFYGNLYHLNAEEEPEGYYYPKHPAFKEKYGPRGVIRSTADGKIEDTGPMTRKRMETADEDFLANGLDFIERADKANKPFVSWPDGGITPFQGEKRTTSEGGFRVPMIVKWPGVIKGGTNDKRNHLARRLDSAATGSGW
jgi:arylsulfatase A-like enzyme